MFRKPKKQIQRRVFSSGLEAEDNNEDRLNDVSPMDVDNDEVSTKKSTSSSKPASIKELKHKVQKAVKQPLLSFGEEDEEGEVFQVRKSSHSKKVMKMLDRERRNKRKGIVSQTHQVTRPIMDDLTQEDDDFNQSNCAPEEGLKSERFFNTPTEIRTDDFVLVIKNSEQENLILNGRAALCAGRDDMSSEEDEGAEVSGQQQKNGHKFERPVPFAKVLQSGVIPDAAMIHAARKTRQRAREQGDFIPVEEPSEELETPNSSNAMCISSATTKGSRLVREDGEDDGSDDEERVDMSAITGVKEREDRREKFYSVQQEFSGEESDNETSKWEDQQIRKGVTGAQLTSAQQESVLAQYSVSAKPMEVEVVPQEDVSTATLLEQAYNQFTANAEDPSDSPATKASLKASGLRTPTEVVDKIKARLTQLHELRDSHQGEMQEISAELIELKLEEEECVQKAPLAAERYRFYQEIRGYVTDLVECLEEKVLEIDFFEQETLTLLSTNAAFLIDRRRQDVLDQAKENSDTKPGQKNKNTDGATSEEERVRRAAEREGRRTRRRRDRERNETCTTHLDGMSSDDEVADQDLALLKSNLEKLGEEATHIFDDADNEFASITPVLEKFTEWRNTDIVSYKNAYINLCLPQLLSPMIRQSLVTWNPLDEKCIDFERMEWFNIAMKYGWTSDETVESLRKDPDTKFVPSLVEKIVVPKLGEIVEGCWDPISTKQTLRLVGLVSRLCREYPSMRPKSKHLRALFVIIRQRIGQTVEHDVYIPIFPKQSQESKTSFFQRQFCSGLKLFRNVLSWQGILSDISLSELAISSLLNRYLLSGMRLCSPADAVAKGSIIVNTLPSAWVQQDSPILKKLTLFIDFLKQLAPQFDATNTANVESIERVTQILAKLHSTE